MADNDAAADIELVDKTEKEDDLVVKPDKPGIQPSTQSIQISEDVDELNPPKQDYKVATPLSSTVDDIAAMDTTGRDEFVRALTADADDDDDNEIAMGVDKKEKETEKEKEKENDKKDKDQTAASQDNDKTNDNKADDNDDNEEVKSNDPVQQAAKQKALGALSTSFTDVYANGNNDESSELNVIQTQESKEILHSRTDTGNSSIMAITLDSSFMDGMDSEFESDDEVLNELKEKQASLANRKGSVNQGGCCWICCAGSGGSRFVSSRGSVKWTMDDENQKKLVESIVFSKKKLKHFLEFHSDYVDDGTDSIPIEDLKALCDDVDLSDQTGIFFFSIVIDKQSQKSHESIWAVLRYLASEMPTPVVAELMHHYRIELSRYNQDKVESVIESLVEGSQFPLATALQMATFFKERAENDLSNVKKLENFSTKYQLWAVKLLNSVESDYLATMMMNAPSFHHHSSPFEIALESELVEFLSSDRIGRIGNALWSKPSLMEPKLSEDAFVMRSTSYSLVHDVLKSNAYDFYFSPLGFYTIETVLFLIYLGIFTGLSIRGGTFNDKITFVDYFFWICIFGFIFNEVFQLGELGVKGYFETWENYLDFSLSFLFLLVILLRIAGNLYEPWQSDGDKNEDLNSPPNVLFSLVWMVNSVLLFLRLYHFLMLSSSEGPLINVTKTMLGDISSFGKVWIVVLAGFAFASYFMVGDTNAWYGNMNRSTFATFLAAIGQPEWAEVSESRKDYAEGRGIDNNTSEERAFANQMIVAVFSVVGFVLLLNLLIAMMANSYATIENSSSKEVLLNKVALAYELDTSAKVMPAPFNAFIFIFFLIYNAIDFAFLALTSSFMNETWAKQWRCRNPKCLFLNNYSIIANAPETQKIFQCSLCEMEHHRDEYILKKCKRRFLRKPRGMDMKGRSCCCVRLWKGLQEFFVSDFNWRKNSWICAYCRVRIPKAYKGDLDVYFSRITKMHKLDDDDVNFIKSLVPEICPHCFRKRRPSLRPVYILEELSYKLFLFTIYPLLRIVLLPAAIIAHIGDSTGNSSHFENFKREYFDKFSLNPSVVKTSKSLPQGHTHQSLLDLNHPIWEAALDHRIGIEKYNDDIDQFTYAIRQERVEVKTNARRKRDILKLSQQMFDMVNERSQAAIVWDLESNEIISNANSIHPNADMNTSGDQMLLHTPSSRKRKRRSARRSGLHTSQKSLDMQKSKSSSLLIKGSSIPLGDSNSNHSVVVSGDGNGNASPTPDKAKEITLNIGGNSNERQSPPPPSKANDNNDNNENESKNNDDNKDNDGDVGNISTKKKAEEENSVQTNKDEEDNTTRKKSVPPPDENTKSKEVETADGRKVTVLSY